MNEKPNPKNSNLSGYIVASILGLLVIGLLLRAMLPQEKTGPRRPRCKNFIKQIGLALHNYHQIHHCFPPAYIADKNGKPMHSWRILILPFIDGRDLYDKYDFDEPWNGPNNSLLHDQISKSYYAQFSCPTDLKKTKDPTMTSYVVVVGNNTAFPGARPTQLSEFFDGDGTSDSILVVEIENSGIHWMEPRDLNFKDLPMKVNPKTGQGISSPHETGAYVLLCDGAVRFIGNSIDPETLRRLLIINDGQPLGDF